MSEIKTRIIDALLILEDYGQVEGMHHQLWVNDQVARALLKDRYQEWLNGRNQGGWEWDEGIAP